MKDIKEISEGIITDIELAKRINDGRVVLLKGKYRDVVLGDNLLIKINTSLGISDIDFTSDEVKKLHLVSTVSYCPDTIMDLSIRCLEKPLYSEAIEIFGGPVGSIPHYICFNKNKGIDKSMLMEEIHKQAEHGVSFMTLHVTARKDLYEKAISRRVIPITSRGGGILLKDIYLNNRIENLLSQYFDDILKIFKKYKVVMSIGTTFRPATIADALDEIQLEEISLQEYYISLAKKAGVQVMMEGIGHATLDKILKYVNILKDFVGIPVMPLGPIPTDAAVGEDHIAAAIGATLMAYSGGAHIINSITREEHTGNIPNIDSILEGLRAAKIAAHIVNIARFPQYRKFDIDLSKTRSLKRSCIAAKGIIDDNDSINQNKPGCIRCNEECPFLIDR